MKKRFDIKVIGQEFSVLSDKGDEYVSKIVQHINERAREIGDASEDVTTSDIAILVALNIAEELFRVRGEKEDLYSRFEGEIEELISYIDKKSKVTPCDVRD
ncbi:MAG: cell division protein ZapA, partial [Syntrophobacterales bacterium]|nr:cell division protein ZapA [Syntrophobacterales bacterium]